LNSFRSRARARAGLAAVAALGLNPGEPWPLGACTWK
jgi:hypothetical protein